MHNLPENPSGAAVCETDGRHAHQAQNRLTQSVQLTFGFRQTLELHCVMRAASALHMKPDETSCTGSPHAFSKAACLCQWRLATATLDEPNFSHVMRKYCTKPAVAMRPACDQAAWKNKSSMGAHGSPQLSRKRLSSSQGACKTMQTDWFILARQPHQMQNEYVCQGFQLKWKPAFTIFTTQPKMLKTCFLFLDYKL